MMHYDEDGDDTTLTEAYRAQLQEDLALVDVELVTSTGTWRTELERRRRHITRELAAGRYLPIEEE